MTRVPAAWLDLREPADHAARAGAECLLPPLVASLGRSPDGTGPPLHIVDVGAGTGSNLRWLAPRLPGPQDWVLVDRDRDLLAHAAQRSAAGTARDGQPVHASIRHADLHDGTALEPTPAGLLTASALLDMLTPASVVHLAAAAARVRATVLFSLTVSGPVTLEPADPLDAALAAAFAAHQRRSVGHERRCGATGTATAAAALRQAGYAVTVAETPWLLGPGRGSLLAEWLRGWVGAALEQDPRLAPAADRWRARRAAEQAAGLLRARVPHQDLLGVPGPAA